MTQRFGFAGGGFKSLTNQRLGTHMFQLEEDLPRQLDALVVQVLHSDHIPLEKEMRRNDCDRKYQPSIMSAMKGHR